MTMNAKVILCSELGVAHTAVQLLLRNGVKLLFPLGQFDHNKCQGGSL